jgi:hypothetical protein
MECSNCNKRIKPIWRDGGDLFYLQCDTCLTYVCRGCADETDDGIVECLSCIQQRALNKGLLELCPTT